MTIRLLDTKRDWPQILRTLRSRWHGLRCEEGSALVELSVTVGLLFVPILLGTVDTATVVYSSIEVSDAAYAGAMYGQVSATNAADTANIRAAAQADAPHFGTGLTVTPTVFYACSSAIGGTQYSTQAAAVSACTGTGNHALEFLQVAASASVKPAFHFAGLPATFTVNDTSVMEVAE
jgi:Flp pilus assembly protein TadG